MHLNGQKKKKKTFMGLKCIFACFICESAVSAQYYSIALQCADIGSISCTHSHSKDWPG